MLHEAVVALQGFFCMCITNLTRTITLKVMNTPRTWRWHSMNIL